MAKWCRSRIEGGKDGTSVEKQRGLPEPVPSWRADGMAGGEFVDGWLVAQVLGEGAYGEVRLLVHAVSGACVALKAVRAEGGEAREAALHRALRHPHVLRCLGARRHGTLHYLFLEYAQGGELFDRIEPDRGMAPGRARLYFRQLLEGLSYLHARGVAHRDLKPENLLLDHRDNLKISDFGMATLFRVGGRERLLARVCGTLPYAAPEVLTAPQRPYRAQPADVWSAALVLLAMLAGELPWERAGVEDARFAAWSAYCEGGGGGGGGGGGSAAIGGPWRKAGGAMALLRRALRPQAVRRATLAELLEERWVARAEDGVAIFPQHSLTFLSSESEPREEISSRSVCAAASEADGARRSWSSQPAARGGAGAWGGEGGALSAAAMDAMLSSSQPAHADDLLLATPAPSPEQQGAAGGALARLVRRMTRVWLRVEAGAAIAALAAVCDEQRAPWRRVQPNVLAIECGGDVCMRAWALPVAGGADGARCLVEFRRSRGCGLAFKRRYVLLRDALLAAAPPAPPPPGLDHAGDDAPMDH